MSKIVIENLYPEFNNLYGDTSNLAYLVKKLALAEVEVEVINTSLFDKPAFACRDDVDLLYIGPCTERKQEAELAALTPYRDALYSRTESDRITLCTGNAFELFGEKIVRHDATELPALSFWGTYAKRFSKLRFNDSCVGSFDEISVVGFKNQLSHSYGETPAPFLSLSVGSGLNPESSLEGARINRFFATYLLGPLLPLNPLFSAELLKTLSPGAEQVTLPFELDAYNKRLIAIQAK